MTVVKFIPSKARASACSDIKKAFVPDWRTIDRRDTANNRGYNSNWRKVQRMFVEQHPFCARCGKLVRMSFSDYVVDHIVPISEGGSLYDFDNLQTLCKSCHNVKTSRDKKSSKNEKN